MSIASEITRLQTAKQDIATAIADKGVPTTGHKMSDFATDVAAIPPGETDARLAPVIDRSITGVLDISDLDITSIAGYAFQGCTNLTGVVPPPGLTSLGSGIFHSCSSLISFVFPSGVTLVPSNCFYASGIQTIDIPSSITTVSLNAFASCAKLRTVKLCAASVRTYTFQNDYYLQNLWISADCTKIEAASWSAAPFRNCTALTDIYCEATAKPDGWGAYWNYKNQTTPITVHWGVSRSAFEAIVGQ